MSFLDRIRDDDKQEVELDPDTVDRTPTRRSRGQTETDEVELQEDTGSSSDPEGSFLPGTGTDTGSSSRSRRDGQETPDDAKLERIMEQNEKIIELLETIAGTDDTGPSSSDPTSGTSSEELW